MKKILFASDLDNTLIHSHRHRTDSDICAEYYEGREQSFLSQKAVLLFRKMIQQKNICFLPVTTRTTAQYQRIFFPDNYRPAYALTANGLILLQGDLPESEWLTASQKRIVPYLPEFRRLESLCLADSRFRHVKFADSLFIACACETAVTAEACLADYASVTTLSGFRTGRKLYFFAPDSDKGTALEKFRKRFPADVVISAGDSEMDLPMLKQADISFFRNQEQDFACHVLEAVLHCAGI